MDISSKMRTPHLQTLRLVWAAVDGRWLLTHWGRDKMVANLADDAFKRIFQNENVRTSIKTSLKFVPKSPIDNNPALLQIMAWRHPGDKPLFEPMMVRSPTHVCVTRPQWVNSFFLHVSINDASPSEINRAHCKTQLILNNFILFHIYSWLLDIVWNNNLNLLSWLKRTWGIFSLHE